MPCRAKILRPAQEGLAWGAGSGVSERVGGGAFPMRISGLRYPSKQDRPHGLSTKGDHASILPLFGTLGLRDKETLKENSDTCFPLLFVLVVPTRVSFS